MAQDIKEVVRQKSEPNLMQTVLSMVEAEQGVSIVPACVRHLRCEGVQFYRLRPDQVRVQLIAAWKEQTPSVALRAFLGLIDRKVLSIIRKRRFLNFAGPLDVAHDAFAALE